MKQRNKKYVSPASVVIWFSDDDIVTTSPSVNGGDNEQYMPDSWNPEA